MKKIFKDSLLFILFIVVFITKDSIYLLFDKKEYNFNYLKENELNYYKTEYENLSNIKNDNNYLISKIIYRDIYSFYKKMVISKGKNYNIKKGDVVVSEDSLVGIIEKVDNTSSTVKLLYNSDLKISVKINDTYGILECINNKLFVNNIVSEASISIGDVIYTSGLTNIMGDIPIAKVINIKESEDKLEKILEVKELTDLKDLKYVMIISGEEL